MLVVICNSFYDAVVDRDMMDRWIDGWMDG